MSISKEAIEALAAIIDDTERKGLPSTEPSWAHYIARKALEAAAPFIIPGDAVEALAAVLAHEALVEADMAGAGWDAENDSPEPFMPRARERATAYLEAAAPPMLAQGWDEGWQACVNYSTYPEIDSQTPTSDNPYRSGQHD